LKPSISTDTGFSTNLEEGGGLRPALLLIVVDEDKKVIDTAINNNEIEQELMEK
jgi:hypothetical protein